MTAREYFWDNVLEVVEVEDAVYEMRHWTEPMTHKEADEYVKKHCISTTNPNAPYYISDRDFCATQKDKFVQRVFKLADLNFYQNREWCERNKLDNFYAVINFILDNELYKAG